MKDTLGIIFSGKNNENTWYNSVYELPIAGRFKALDFILSSMVNSGIKKIGVVTNAMTTSLYDHLQSGDAWGLHKNEHGLYILPCGKDYLNEWGSVYDFIKSSREKYVLIAGCDFVYNMTFDELVKFHIEKNSDITFMHSGFDIENGVAPEKHKIPLNIYLINRYLILKLIENALRKKKSIQECVNDNLPKLRFFAFGYKGHLFLKDSPAAYLNSCKKLLDSSFRQSFLCGENKIYTAVKNYSPLKCSQNADVKDSLLADGSLIEGNVFGSMLFCGVRVISGASIIDSVVMDKCYIGRNCRLENVILKEDCIIKEGISVCGSTDKPLVLEKGSIVSKDMVLEKFDKMQ